MIDLSLTIDSKDRAFCLYHSDYISCTWDDIWFVVDIQRICFERIPPPTPKKSKQTDRKRHNSLFPEMERENRRSGLYSR